MSLHREGTADMEKLEEEYEPTAKELHDYALWLGMDPDKDSDLLWIARQGLKTPLPCPWKACESASGDIFYFNPQTGTSTWDHPCDEELRRLFKTEREKKASGGASSQGDGEAFLHSGSLEAHAEPRSDEAARLETADTRIEANQDSCEFEALDMLNSSDEDLCLEKSSHEDADAEEETRLPLRFQALTQARGLGANRPMPGRPPLPPPFRSSPSPLSPSGQIPQPLSPSRSGPIEQQASRPESPTGSSPGPAGLGELSPVQETHEHLEDKSSPPRVLTRQPATLEGHAALLSPPCRVIQLVLDSPSPETPPSQEKRSSQHTTSSEKEQELSLWSQIDEALETHRCSQSPQQSPGCGSLEFSSLSAALESSLTDSAGRGQGHAADEAAAATLWSLKRELEGPEPDSQPRSDVPSPSRVSPGAGVPRVPLERLGADAHTAGSASVQAAVQTQERLAPETQDAATEALHLSQDSAEAGSPALSQDETQKLQRLQAELESLRKKVAHLVPITEVDALRRELESMREAVGDTERCLEDAVHELQLERAAHGATKAVLRESQREAQRLKSKSRLQTLEAEQAMSELQRCRMELADAEAEGQLLRLQLQAKEGELGQLRQSRCSLASPRPQHEEGGELRRSRRSNPLTGSREALRRSQSAPRGEMAAAAAAAAAAEAAAMKAAAAAMAAASAVAVVVGSEGRDRAGASRCSRSSASSLSLRDARDLGLQSDEDHEEPGLAPNKGAGRGSAAEDLPEPADVRLSRDFGEELRTRRRQLRKEHNELEEARRIWRCDAKRLRKAPAADAAEQEGITRRRLELDARAVTLNKSIDEYRTLQRMAVGATKRASSHVLQAGHSDCSRFSRPNVARARSSSREERLLRRWRGMLGTSSQAAQRYGHSSKCDELQVGSIGPSAYSFGANWGGSFGGSTPLLPHARPTVGGA